MSIYSFITGESFGELISTSLKDQKKMSVNWVMPPPSRQSGGHINMFRFILGLEKRGIDCRVVVCNYGMLNPPEIDEQGLQKNINDWFGSFKGSVFRLENMPAATMTMATGWQSAYAVNQFRSTIHKGYFVQDFEPEFYPKGAEYSFAEQTYRFGFTGFTAGSWLSSKLKAEYGMTTFPLSFSFDKSLYRCKGKNNLDVEHLLCYVRPETIRRGWDLVNLALEEVQKAKPNVRFILVGGKVDTDALSYKAFNPGSIKVEELADLYSQCKAALILSCTNLSLLPLEVMSCGVPVISNKGANTEWLLHSGVAKLADLEPKKIAQAVVEVLSLDKEEYSNVVSKGLAFSQSSNWETQIDKLEKTITTMATPLKLEAFAT